MKVKLLLLVPVLTFFGLSIAAFSAGSITGQGRFEKIAGNPAAGYKYLYEWDLFMSPADNSFIGPFRRLGAPPNQNPTGDGYYRIDNLSAGNYSILVSQPDFFASPKVIANVQISDGQTTTLNVDLDIDYSTYFSDSGQWTDWGPWDWYQTFRATGTSVRGVSWRMAGSGLYRNKTAQVRILEDNGDANVKNWRQVGYGTDSALGADSDEWVRWRSSEVPLVAGKMYAVDIHIDGGLAIYKRNKDSQSYPHGRAYDQDGIPQNFDLNITVFVDKDNQAVTHTRKSPGPGNFSGNLYALQWGQTFVATGTSLAAVDLFAAGYDGLHLTWTVRRDGPAGPRIGPTKSVYGAYFATSTDLLGVSYNPGEVPLTPGQTYYIEAFNGEGFIPYTQETWNACADGVAWQNGIATSYDLAMTIIQYTHPAPAETPVGLVACYLLDKGEGMTAHDASGHEHTGYIRNANPGIWVPGRSGSALDFDGQNDYVQITGYKGLLGSQPRTCAAWIKTTTPGGDILAWGKIGVVGGRWIMRTDEAGRLRVEVGGGAAVGTATVADGQWRHVAVTFAGGDAGEVRFYLDGLPDPTSSNTLPPINTVAGGDTTIAAYLDVARYFRGALDDVVLFDMALTGAQVRHLCTASAATFLNPCGDVLLEEVFGRPADINRDCIINLTDASILAAAWLGSGLLASDIFNDDIVNFADLTMLADDYLLSITPGLMVHLPFDESSGLVASDSSVGGHAGTLVNMDDGAWVPGRLGNALAFDGVDDSVVITRYKGIGGGHSRTVCAWIKTADTDGQIVSWGHNVAGGRWVFRTEAQGRIRLEVGGGAIVGSASVCDDQWHHVAVVLNNDGSPNVNELKLYVDGQPDMPTTASDRPIDTVTDDPAAPDVAVGVYPPVAKPFQGLIDDLRIYTRPLTAEGIADLAH